MDDKEAQAAISRAEYAATLRIQQAANGYIVKGPKGPMVFGKFEDAADFMRAYFLRSEQAATKAYDGI